MTYQDLDIRRASTSGETRPDGTQVTSPIDMSLRLSLAQMSMIVVWATDADLRFTLFEGGGLVALGVGPNDVVGQDLFEFFATDDPSFEPIAAHRRALAGDLQTYELEWGGRTYLSCLEPLRFGGPEIHGVVGVAIDVTERIQAERELGTTIGSLRAAGQTRRDLLRRLIDAEDQERRRIALDVHDGPIQEMVAIGLRLQMLGERVDDPEVTQGLDQIAEALGSTARGLRRLVFELVPPSLEREGLAVALGELLAQLEERTGLTVRLEDQLPVEPPTTVATVCFRIVQEAVTNVRKHARAHRLDVLLTGRDDGVSITVRDDGVGFDPSTPVQDGHLGLAGMQQRAQFGGGWLRIDSTPGSGTSVEFWLPLDL